MPWYRLNSWGLYLSRLGPNRRLEKNLQVLTTEKWFQSSLSLKLGKAASRTSLDLGDSNKELNIQIFYRA